MKKYLLHLLLLSAVQFSSTTSTCQIIADVVSQGAGYANQVWYSMENGELLSAPKTEWDLAFSIGSFSSSIHINSAAGNSVKVYPNGAIGDWENVDISGFDAWPTLNNSATSWELGAFDQNNSGSTLDFGWGIYNPVTHFVNGDSIYIIQTSQGDFKKLKLNELTLQGVYNFELADINGDNQQTLALNKSDYSGKLFGYYSIINHEFLDREPQSSAWELLFTQYTDYVPTAYTVAGVLHHPNVIVAQANGVDQQNFIDFNTIPFSEDINTIGYDWKSFNGATFDIANEVVYFIQDQNENIWKVVFTGFGGSANGDYYFTKEKLITSSSRELESLHVLEVYPNPAHDFIQITTAGASQAHCQIMDLQGRLLHKDNLIIGENLQTTRLDISHLSPGIYLLQIIANGASSTHKIQVN